MRGDYDKNKKMKNSFFIFCGLALSMVCAYSDGGDYKKPVVEDVDFFPKFESLKPPILMPQNAEIKISDDGHFLVNGKPRYLEGTLFYEGDSLSVDVPTYGYPPSLKWLYETTQNYEDLQRIGFDTVGTGIPNDWMQKYRKRFIHLRANEKMFLRYAQSGLPLYVDFTAAEWSHGGLEYVEGMEPSKEAFTVRGSSYHWMPYSANTKEGRQLWREMWESGVQYLKKYSIKPFIYELFNEPIYDDLSDFNKRKFAKEMEVKYGGKIDRLNKDWGTSYADFTEIAGFKKYDENVGLFVEWIKFMEDSFADLCKYGAKIIREADGRPDVAICFQPIFLDGNNVNIYKTNKSLNAVCASTGGGDFFQVRYLKAISDGKPIFDGETYMGHTRESFRDKILTQYMRGLNASYLFKWSRRPNDPAWKLPNGGVRLAEIFPYMVLNPYAVNPHAFLGLMDAKKIISEVDELFTPRKRGVKSDVAVVYSYPTNRLQRYPKAPPLQTEMEKKLAAALEYSQVQYDVVLEEQARKGRHNRYKALFSAGAAAYKYTPRKLLDYAERGGTLILLYDALTLDEYGHPLKNNITGIEFGEDKSAVSGELKVGGAAMKAFHFKSVKMPDDWKAIGFIDSEPAIWEKTVGKGKMIFINAKVSGTDMRRLAVELLKGAGVEKLCEIENAITGASCAAVEIAKASAEGKVGYMLFNRSMDAEPIAIKPPEKLVFAEIVSRRIIEPDADGRLLISMPAGSPAVFVGVAPDAAAETFKDFKKLSADDAAREVSSWYKKIREEKMKSEQAYYADAADLRTVPMREFVNLDRNAELPTGNSKSEIKSLPWSVENCNGIAFDFIRPDHNNNLTAIGLGDFGKYGKFSELKGVKIDSKAACIYFLHAAAGDVDGEIMRYIVNYSDGSKEEIPVVAGRNIGAWDKILTPDKNAETAPGFIDPQNRGLYIWKWENPNPNKLVKSIDAVLTRPTAATITTGITVETPKGDSDYEVLKLKPAAENPIKFINCDNGKFDGRFVEMSAANMRGHARFTMLLDAPCKLPENAPEGSIAFDIEVGGKELPPRFYVALDKTVNNVRFSSKGMLYKIGAGKYRVQIPLNKLLKNEGDSFDKITVQVDGAPSGFKDIKIGNFELIAYRDKNPLRWDSFELSAWGGVKAGKGRGYIALDIDNDSNDWCLGTLKLLRPLAVDGNFRNKTLTFRINGGEDILGNRNIGGQPFQMSLGVVGADGKKGGSQTLVISKGGFISGESVDTSPTTWQKVSIPIARIFPKNAEDVKEITSIALQYMKLPSDRAGVWIKDLRLE